VRVPRSALTLLAVTFAACGFNPHPKDGQLPCDKGCPSGYVCTANRCWQNASIASGGGGTTGPVGTGGMDAAVSGTGGTTHSTGGATFGTGGAVSSGGIGTNGGSTGSGGITGTGGLSGGVTGRGGSTAAGGTTGSGGIAGTGGLLTTGGITGAGGMVVPRLAVFAGVPSGVGSGDGTGSAARFNTPYDVAVDGLGNVFVADEGNYTIRKITPAGVVTTLAGSASLSGNVDGTGTAARFGRPWGVAVDGAGNVFVADIDNNTIRKITPAGVVTTFAGSAVEGSTDGTGAAARFRGPADVAVDGTGNLFVADSGNGTIRRITPAGVVTTLAGSAGLEGHTDALAVDGAGNVFVADTFNGTIRKLTPTGVVTTLAYNVAAPLGVAVDGTGNIVVADAGSQTIRKITPSGVVTTLAGMANSSGSADGAGADARFFLPKGVAVDGAGNVFVADTNNNAIRKITPAAVVTTLAGSADFPGSADGTGNAARFSMNFMGDPSGIAVDWTGNVFVTDNGNNTIRRITPAGVVTTLAGSAADDSGSADGTGAAARFNHPSGIAVDSAGNVFVADTTYNDTIRRITPAGVVTTFAGTVGSHGSADGTGATASFQHPSGVAVDAVGNVFVADTANYTIRKITPAGVVTTLAGTAGTPGSADGTGTSALFNWPSGVAVDGTGNVFVTDNGNNTIRKITPAGVVTTLAGTAGTPGSADGTGDAARFNSPKGVALDGMGNVFVADTNNNAVRKITPSGVVSTVVGVAAPTSTGNLPGPLPASVRYPVGVAIDASSGKLYITLPDAVMVAQGLL
jgi:streptogramin lyase